MEIFRWPGEHRIQARQGADFRIEHRPSRGFGRTGEQNDSVDLEESIFAFSKAPEDQIGRVTKGGSTGAKVRLEPAQSGNKERVLISLNGKEASFDVAEKSWTRCRNRRNSVYCKDRELLAGFSDSGWQNRLSDGSAE